MNPSTKQKQTHRHIEIRLVVAKGEGERERGRLGVWGEQMQTITFRTDKQQGPNV